MSMKIGILGGGVTGLTAAYELLEKGHEILLLEKERELGGVLRSVKVGDTPIEEYYHHVFPDDKNFFEFLKELCLGDRIEKVEGTTGFYYKNTLYNLTSPLDLLFYKPLSFKDKVKLAKIVLKIKRIKHPSNYSDKNLKDWIIKNSNKNVYENFFKPLLQSKYGKNFENASVAWFIERIKLRTNRGLGGEELYYMKGGFEKFLKEIKKNIKQKGGKIIVNTSPEKIETKNGRVYKLVYKGKSEKIDGLISTIPPKYLNALLNKKVFPEFDYQGSICVLLGLEKSLCDYYWTNIIKDNFSFGSYIEHTNIQPKSLYGQVVSYLASYHDLESKIWEKSDKEIFEKYFSDLKKIFNVKKSDINFWKVFKTKNAGIIYKKDIRPDMMKETTSIPNLFVGGMFNSYPERNIDSSVKLGKECARKVIS